MDIEDVEIGEEFEKDGKKWLKIDEDNAALIFELDDLVTKH